MSKLIFSILAIFIFKTSMAVNADSLWFVSNYVKKEVYIPMRDGVKLFTSIYIPKDELEKHPFLMTRTPYSCAPYGEEKYMALWNNYKMNYAKENYIFVSQDVRGRYMSYGKFEDVRPLIKIKKAMKLMKPATRMIR